MGHQLALARSVAPIASAFTMRNFWSFTSFAVAPLRVSPTVMPSMTASADSANPNPVHLSTREASTDTVAPVLSSVCALVALVQFVEPQPVSVTLPTHVVAVELAVVSASTSTCNATHNTVASSAVCRIVSLRR